MNYRKVVVMFTLLILALLFIPGCDRRVEVSSQTAMVPAETKAREERGSWEMEWERVIREGKKEGRVVLYTIWRPEAREALSKAFKSRHGIDIEFILGRGPDLVTKLLAERRAGLYYADIFISGASTLMTVLLPAGIFTPIEEALILPEVKDPKAWMDGRYPFIDKKGLIFHATAHDAGGDAIIYNSQFVRKDEIRSWRDLLNPKFKGKIAMDDPTVAGRGQQVFAVGAEFLGLDYWRELARQEVALTRDRRLQVDWLAKGRYFAALAALNEIYREYQHAGVPIEIAQNLTDEFRYLSTAASNIGIISDPPHPNATRVFLNWFLTKEALTIFVRETQWQSTRLDVPTDIVDELKLRMPGFKYFNAESEEFTQKKLKYEEKAREIFGPAR